MRPTLGLSISRTIYDRERGWQLDCVKVYSRDPIGFKITKMGAITAESPYHVQVWKNPHSPWGVLKKPKH